MVRSKRRLARRVFVLLLALVGGVAVAGWRSGWWLLRWNATTLMLIAILLIALYNLSLISVHQWMLRQRRRRQQSAATTPADSSSSDDIT